MIRASVPLTLDELAFEDAAIAESDDAERRFAYGPSGQIAQLTVRVLLSFTGEPAELPSAPLHTRARAQTHRRRRRALIAQSGPALTPAPPRPHRQAKARSAT